MLAFIAFSLQAAYAFSHGPAALQDSNIRVPESSIPKWFASTKSAKTHILVWNGSPQIRHEGFETPSPSLYGPLVLASPPGYYPSDILGAYGVPALQGSNAIAIVDAFDYPTALADFNHFSTQFGLPTESSATSTLSSNPVFQVVYASGAKPTQNKGWNEEAALDIEWAHAIAPNAKIYLVEAASDSTADLYAAEQLAATLPGVQEVSNSWGGDEASDELTYDSTFAAPGVVYFASSGDTGGITEYPAVSPNVVGVGGTSLVYSKGKVLSETAWRGSGGGTSSYEPISSYQASIASTVGTHRGSPDLSSVADPYTGVAVYDSFDGWFVVGGTSVASPVVAAIVNGLGSFQSSSVNELTLLYSELGTGRFRDITSGRAGRFRATSGWDFTTGSGSLLASTVTAPPPTLTIPSLGVVSATPGSTVSYKLVPIDTATPARTVTSLITSGPTWATWDGQKLTLSPPITVAPGNYTVALAASDNGSPQLTATGSVTINIPTPHVSSINFAANSVVGGASIQATVTISGPAPTGGATVTFDVSPPLHRPASLVIAAGQTSGVVTVATDAVRRSTTGVIIAYYGNWMAWNTIRVTKN